MPEDPWVEPRARIPLAGIVAIVLIVAVVAVFLKTQLSAVFPATTIQVSDAQGAQTINVAGSASATYQGLREVNLARKERLVGVLQTASGARVYSVDVGQRVLTVTRDDAPVTAQLQPSTAGGLTASLELDGLPVQVAVAPLDRQLTVSSGASANPISLPLTETLAYEGFFDYYGERLLFQYVPTQDAVRITGSQVDSIALTKEADGTLSGTWSHGENSYPVRVDLAQGEATIASVW